MATLTPGLMPFDVIIGLNGRPLNGGQVYIGEPNKDPEQFPQQVFWDAEGTIPAAQPLETADGYVVRTGTPARWWTDGAYSITVRDRHGRQVFHDKDVEFTLPDGCVDASSLSDDQMDLQEIAQKLGWPVVNVLAYGADPTGDTVSNDALAAAVATGALAYHPPGKFRYDNPNLTTKAGVIGAGRRATEIVLESGTLFHVDGTKGAVNGGFTLSQQAATGKAIIYGGVWQSVMRDIWFYGPSPSAARIGLALGNLASDSEYGCQNNCFENLFFENCDLEIAAYQTYVNANRFDIQMFIGTGLIIYNTARDAHGNVFTGVFQNCREVSDLRGQGNLMVGAYLEECHTSGSFTEIGCTINGASADDRSRTDKISFTRVGTTQSYDNGPKNWLPLGAQIYKDERFLPLGAPVVAAGTAPSVSGLKTQLIDTVGLTRFISVLTNEEVAPLIAAYGAVSVSFDAVRVGGSAGAVEIAPGQYVSPIVATPFWQRYAYTITSPDGFLRLYASNDQPGHVEICNISYGPGRTACLGAPSKVPVFIKQDAGNRYEYDNGFYHGRLTKSFSGVTSAPLLDLGAIGNGTVISGNVRIMCYDGVNPHGIATITGTVMRGRISGDASTFRGSWQQISSSIDGDAFTAPTIAFDKVTGTLTLTSTSGALNVYLVFEYSTNALPQVA